MLLILDLIVLSVIGTITFAAFLKSFKTRMIRSADLVCGMIFLFYAMPLLYDYMISSTPAPWFYHSWADPGVRIKYDIILILSVLMIKFGALRWRSLTARGQQPSGFTLTPLQPSNTVQMFVMLGWLFLFLPIPSVLLFSNNPSVYLSYAGMIGRGYVLKGAESANASFIMMACIAALMGFFIVYWTRTRMMRTAMDPVRLFALFLAVIAVWIHGKRTAVAFLMLILIFVNFFERRLKLSSVLLSFAVAVIGGYFYIGYAKGYEKSPLEYLRGDLSRDYTLRHAIYYSSWKGSEVVPYRGAGYVFDAAFFVPRQLWPGKPWPSPVYFTNHVFNWTQSPYMGWGFGFGFIEELIINFGYVGLLGCILIGWISRRLDDFIYTRSSYYALLWLPMVFGTVFASSVIIKVILFMVIPAMLLARVFAGSQAWTPMYSPQMYYPHPGQYPFQQQYPAQPQTPFRHDP